MLTLGLLGSAFALLAQGNSSRDEFQSPPTTPFMDPLPLPPAPKEMEGPRAGGIPREFRDLDPACSQFVDGTGNEQAHFFEIVSEVRKVQFHSQLPPTEIWGYRDGNLPPGQTWPFALGPTFVRNIVSGAAIDPGESFRGTIVRHFNELPAVRDHQGFGEPRLTVHLHGGHHPPHSDGFPSNLLSPDGTVSEKFTFDRGEHFDYCYPLLDPGFLSQERGASGEFDDTENPSTLWYHDHLLDFTGENVYRGLAGFFLVFDANDPATARDTNDETNAANLPHALRLPSGEFDVPLALQEKSFGPNGELIFDQFNFDGFLGDKFLVNGKVQPFFDVKRRKYRFRFLNASNARIYQLFLTDNRGHTFPMTQIATEGGLMSKPIERESFMLSMAERIEVVIDFSQFPDQTELFMENRLAQDDGRGPGGTFEDPDLLPSGTKILKFNLKEHVADPSRVPKELRPFKQVTAAEKASAVRRSFEFERRDGLWVINGQVADVQQALAAPTIDGPEIWHLVNKSGGWWHPIHIHDEFARVLTRNGEVPFGGTGVDHGQSVEQDGVAKKDTILLGPNSEVEVFLKFRDYEGPFVFHCHNMEHEDHAMMGRFDVTKKR